MPLKKSSSKLTDVTSKPMKKALQKAHKRPYLWLVVLAALPLLALLIYSSGGGRTVDRKGKEAKAAKIVVRQTPQEIAQEATTALRRGDTVAFFDVVETKVKDPNIVNSQGDTLLLAAATLGNVEAVQRLLAMGADVNKQNAYTRDTPILRSVYGDHDEITRLLIYADADLNLPNNYRQTPIGLAVEKQKGELVDLFLTSGVKAGLDGNTLLRASAQKNLVGVVGMLKGGVNPNVKNQPGNTPLIISASLGDTPSVQALLSYRADINAANNDGNTALIYAARYNHPDTVMALMAPLNLQYRVDMNAQNKKGETALYWAAMKGYAPVVRILLAYDADKNIQTLEGLSALDVAKKYKRTKVIELLEMDLNELKTQFNQELSAQQAAEAEATLAQAEQQNAA